MAEILLDLRGLKCPLPALRLRKALGPAQPGQIFRVECTDPLSVIDIPHLVRETRDTLLGQDKSETIFVFTVRREARE